MRKRPAKGEQAMNPRIGVTLAKEIKAVGISVVGDDASGLKFKCKSCRKEWSIRWDAEEEQAVNGWWRCPGGCNANLVRSSDIDFRQLWRGGQGGTK
jgi:hypothetical protein